jgi:hypothetical protein
MRTGVPPVAKGARRLVGEQRRHRVEHGDVDELSATQPVAHEERREDPLHGEHAGRDVGNRDAEPERRSVGAPVMLINPPSACIIAS